MRRILTALALTGLLGSVVLSNVARAECHTGGAACATAAPKHAPCLVSERTSKCFARWDACREKVSGRIDKFFNPTCFQHGYVGVIQHPAAPVCSSPQAVASGQGN